jgi:hypothetical protein
MTDENNKWHSLFEDKEKLHFNRCIDIVIAHIKTSYYAPKVVVQLIEQLRK